MAEAPAPTRPADAYRPGAWVIFRHARTRPARVVRVVPYPGVPCGYLVEHDGPGVSAFSGDDVRPCPPDRIPTAPRQSSLR